MHYVLIDPTGCANDELFLIVQSPTGVTYQQQCGGLTCDQRSAEGFLIPLLGANNKAGEPFDDAFLPFGELKPEAIQNLADAVAKLECWLSSKTHGDTCHQLSLDASRIEDCVEAWIPVITPYGPGILISANSD